MTKRTRSKTTVRFFPGKVRLALPPILHGVVGLETSVYFDNVILVPNVANHAFRVRCPKGVHQAERWTFTPSPGDVRDHEFVLEVFNADNAVIARARSTVHIVPADAGAGRQISLLAIGDSLTHVGRYPRFLLELCQLPGNPALRLVGSHQDDPDLGSDVRHEGYGGWTAEAFITKFAPGSRRGHYTQRGSPFLYEVPGGKPRLNFHRYCDEFNGGKGPDFATIFLGPNDVFRADDGNIEREIDVMLRYYDRIIRMIRGVRNDTRIGAIPPIPPAASQDAFGANYGTEQTRWQYRRNQHRVVERMIRHYAPGRIPGLDLIAAYPNLDTEFGYPRETKPRHGRTAEVCSRLANGCHPTDDGYRQIADSLYAWLKAVLL